MTEHIFYNALNIVAKSDYRHLSRLKERYGGWKEAWGALPQEEKLSLVPQNEWRELERLRIQLILAEDASYPALLKEIPFPPFGIYVQGALPDNAKRCVAIVGTRKATESGKECAKNFSYQLAERGFVIVSGLALGIDGASHRGALDAHGRTIAVLANGLDRVYPRFNAKIGKEILAENGALVSEYPLGSPTLPYRFLERNRIVSGLSGGVLIVEAPKISGALATARFALEQNRDVFVIPGPITHPNFEGSLQLIRDGAHLITKPEEITEILLPGSDATPMRRGDDFLFQTKEEKIIAEILRASAEPLPVDKIIELTNLKANVVNQTVSFLVLKNILEETAEGFAMRPPHA